MTLPGTGEILQVLEATWPAARVVNLDGWTIRDGRGGGNRVSAATRNSDTPGPIEIAEKAMQDLDQPQKFRIGSNDSELDTKLAGRGYAKRYPTLLYAAPVADLTDVPVPRMSSFAFWPPLEIVKEIWAEGGIGPGRLAVMDRVRVPKTSILGRTENRASAAAFVAFERKIAMLHALEVPEIMRRRGIGRNILRAAALWAQENGANTLSLAVTAANSPANALYLKSGMSVVGKYHYRVKENKKRTEAASER